VGSIRAPKLPGNGSKGARACRSGGSSSPRRGVNDTSGAPARPAPRGSPAPDATGPAAARRVRDSPPLPKSSKGRRDRRRRGGAHLAGRASGRARASPASCAARPAIVHPPPRCCPPPLLRAPRAVGCCSAGARARRRAGLGRRHPGEDGAGCPGRRARRSFRSRSRTRAHPQPAPPDAGPRVGASAAARRGREQAALLHLDGARHLRRAPAADAADERTPRRWLQNQTHLHRRRRRPLTSRSPPARHAPLRGTRRPGVRGNQGVEGARRTPTP